jgi:hypothetical protein
VTERTASPATRIADRYGRAPRAQRRSRLGVLVTVGVLVLLTLAWAVWTGIGGTTTTLVTSTNAFTVRSPEVTTVQWTVSGREHDRLICAIEAQTDDATVVGLVEVVVPVTGRVDRTGFTEVRTIRAATSGLIDSCRGA